MIFEEEAQDHQQQSYETASRTEQTFAQIYQNQGNSDETINFSSMSKFFTLLSQARGGKKSQYIKKFITILFKKNRKHQFTYSIMRLIIPSDDKDRGNYGLKQKALARLIAQCLNLNKSEYERLYHYKNPNYHREGMGIGDFSICMYDVIKGYLRPSSSLNVRRLNQILDQLANTTDQIKYFRDLLKQSNAIEMKWIVRIILKDLKLGIKIQTVLTTFHPDGNQYFNLTGSLLQTCKKFQNPKISLSDEVQLFHPIRPMLAGKKKIDFFKNETRTFYLETKYDGQRLQVHLDSEKVKLFSRNGVDYNYVYEDMVQILQQAIQADACILDGQIIVIDKQEDKMMPFGLNKTVALNRQTDNLQLCYKIFDIMWLKVENQEMNLMVYPLRERKKILPKVINQIPKQVELVKFRQILEYDDILREFNASLERNEEGVMLKDPNSIYVPKQRANNWLKLKGDYVDGMTDTMDVVIIGGYFGDLSFRLGDQGSHWTNQVTSFLVAVLDHTSVTENNKNIYALPFARVGTGFSKDDLIQLRARLKPHLYQYNGRNKPQFMKCQWKYTITNKPNCYLNDLKNSVILEVKAAQIVASQNFATDCTLRFARCMKIRYDKDWAEGLTKEQLDDLLNEANYTKTIKKKNQQASDSDQQRPREPKIRQRKTGQSAGKKKVIKDALLEDYKTVDVSQQKLVSHLFHGKQFHVLPLDNCAFTTHEIEKMILLNNGKVSKNPLQKTHYIVSEEVGFRQKAYEKYQKGKYIFIKPKYIKNCIQQQKIIPLSPLYLTILPNSNSKFYKDNFDKYCDSYTNNLDMRDLDEILNAMGSNQLQISQQLMGIIGFKYSRSDKVSYCIGVKELFKIKLRKNGNNFVQSLQEKPNSIILSRDLGGNIQQILDYVSKWGCELQYIQNLTEMNVI